MGQPGHRCRPERRMPSSPEVGYRRWPAWLMLVSSHNSCEIWRIWQKSVARPLLEKVATLVVYNIKKLTNAWTARKLTSQNFFRHKARVISKWNPYILTNLALFHCCSETPLMNVLEWLITKSKGFNVFPFIVIKSAENIEMSANFVISITVWVFINNQVRYLIWTVKISRQIKLECNAELFDLSCEVFSIGSLPWSMNICKNCSSSLGSSGSHSFILSSL